MDGRRPPNRGVGSRGLHPAHCREGTSVGRLGTDRCPFAYRSPPSVPALETTREAPEAIERARIDPRGKAAEARLEIAHRPGLEPAATADVQVRRDPPGRQFVVDLPVEVGVEL